MQNFLCALRFVDTSKRIAIVLSILAAMFAFVVFDRIALAQGAQAQAFGTSNFSGVDGMRALVWTAQQPPAVNNFRASPVSVCTTDSPCAGPLVETGYNMGDNSLPNPNVLQQYASYLTTTNVIGGKFGLGNLADNMWYEFRVQRRGTGNKWDVFRDGVKVWTTPGIGFNQGSMVVCGAEAFQMGTNMAVQCNSMQRRLGGVWALFDYTLTQTSGTYQVVRPQQFSALGFGP